MTSMQSYSILISVSFFTQSKPAQRLHLQRIKDKFDAANVIIKAFVIIEHERPLGRNLLIILNRLDVQFNVVCSKSVQLRFM